MSDIRKDIDKEEKAPESPEKASKAKEFTLTRIGKLPHQLLRKMAALDDMGMQELLDRIVMDYKEKKYPGL